VSHEKNIESFLEIDIDAYKQVVGGGPALEGLKASYPEAEYLGYLHGEELAQVYSDADVCVFPSKTDTFGLTIIEALACGTPVAAYPVTGPKDILKPGAGCVAEDLKEAVERTLKESSTKACLRLAKQYSWKESAKRFTANLVLKEQDGT
jgi:glycosyltransferase involved in cell wall biosynthesis